jgi:hypothetical protein
MYFSLKVANTETIYPNIVCAWSAAGWSFFASVYGILKQQLVCCLTTKNQTARKTQRMKMKMKMKRKRKSHQQKKNHHQQQPVAEGEP